MKKILILFLAALSLQTFGQTVVRMSATASGANTYSTTFNPTVSTFNQSTIYVIPFTNANSSGTVTVDPDAGGAGSAIAIKGADGNDLDVGAIVAGGTYSFKFNGTLLRMMGAWEQDLGGGGGGPTSGNGTTVVGTAVNLGSTLTGNVVYTTGGNETRWTSTGTDESKIILDAPNNIRRGITFRTGNVERWQFHMENNETGVSNAGGDLHFERYNDAGVQIDAPFGIGRTDGVAFFNKPPILTAAPAPAANNTEVPTTAWVQTELSSKQNTITFGTGVQTALGVNIGSAGAPVLFNGAGGTPSSITLTNGAGLPGATGITGRIDEANITAKYILDSSTPSTAGGTITLDLNSQAQRVFVGSASFASAKIIALSNTTNALVFNAFFNITNVAATLTLPSDFIMMTTDARWNTATQVWTPNATGLYELSATWDGTSWYVKITDPFN